MDSELRRNIQRRWLSSIFELSHIEFQKQLWLNTNYRNLVGDFTEAICQYFDDLDLNEGYDIFIEKGLISWKEYNVLKGFHFQLNDYVEKSRKLNCTDLDVLEDPDWIAVVNSGNLSWSKLKKVLTSKENLGYMISLEEKYLRNNT